MTIKSFGYLSFVFLALYLFFRYVMPYMLPFALGIVIAAVLEPVAAFLSGKLGLKRSWSALIALVAVLVLAGLAVSLAAARIAAELTEMYRYLPQYYVDFNRVLNQVLAVAGEVSRGLPEPIARLAQDQWNRLYSVLSVIVTGAGGFVKGLPAFSVTVLFTLLTAYFVMRDREQIAEFLRTVIPGKHYSKLKTMQTDMFRGLAGFIRAQILLVLLTMALNIIGLSILNVRYSVAIGMVLAVLDILPVIGPGLLYFPWIGYQIFWGRAETAIGLAVIYGSVSVLRQIAQTHLVGREMGLHPIVTLVSLYAGFKLFGVAGLVYGPMTAILVKGLWSYGIIPREGGGS